VEGVLFFPQDYAGGSCDKYDAQHQTESAGNDMVSGKNPRPDSDAGGRQDQKKKISESIFLGYFDFHIWFSPMPVLQ
jgi:hypothetical protein